MISGNKVRHCCQYRMVPRAIILPS